MILKRMIHRDRKDRAAAPLTCAQLGTAIAAAEATGLYRAGPAMLALNGLFDALTSDASRDSDPVSVPDGPLPVSSAQVDQALEEAREAGLDAKTLGVLKKAGALLARAEEAQEAQRSCAGSAPLPRVEFEAFVKAVAIAIDNLERARDRAGYQDGRLNYRLAKIAKLGDNFGLSQDELAALKRLMKALDGASERDGIAQRKAAEGRVNGVRGSNGLNF